MFEQALQEKRTPYLGRFSRLASWLSGNAALRRGRGRCEPDRVCSLLLAFFLFTAQFPGLAFNFTTSMRGVEVGWTMLPGQGLLPADAVGLMLWSTKCALQHAAISTQLFFGGFDDRLADFASAALGALLAFDPTDARGTDSSDSESQRAMP